MVPAHNAFSSYSKSNSQAASKSQKDVRVFVQSDNSDASHMPAADAVEHMSNSTKAQTSLDPGQASVPGLISMASIKLMTDNTNSSDPAIKTNDLPNMDTQKNYQPWA